MHTKLLTTPSTPTQFWRTFAQRFILASLLLLLVPLAQAAPALKPIPVEQAFQLSAQVTNSHTITLKWDIKKNYYLYRDRFNFKVVSPKTALLSDPIMPSGTEKVLAGSSYTIYQDTLSVPLTITGAKSGKVLLLIAYQGCSQSGYCYPPIEQTIALNLQSIGLVAYGVDADSSSAKKTVAKDELSGAPQIQTGLSKVLGEHNFFLVLALFFGFGFLLAFTPCILPMIPILSGIIIGHGKTLTTGKAFKLSLTYVLSMACTYAAAGVLAGLAGTQLQSALQKPWILASFAAVFVLLACSLFGLFELRLPRSWTQSLSNVNKHQKGGSYLGVVIMGCLATLIASPCITPPLVGALAYISSTHDYLLGGTALFSMGLGMGLPLIIVGTYGGKFLPKAGQWMNAVKAFFGVLLLGVAIWLLMRVIPGPVSLALWAGLLIICAVYLGSFKSPHNNNWRKLSQGVGLVFAIYGILLLAGAGLGNSDPLHPLANLSANKTKTAHLEFVTVNNLAQTKQALASAKASGRPAIIDFYADWCISCQIMEKQVFNNPEVVQALSNFALIKADVTENNAANKALQRHFGVFAPPSLLFFNADGQALNDASLVGEINAKEFLAHLGKHYPVNQAKNRQLSR